MSATYKSGSVWLPSGAGYRASYVLEDPEPCIAYALNLETLGGKYDKGIVAVPSHVSPPMDEVYFKGNKSCCQKSKDQLRTYFG